MATKKAPRRTAERILLSSLALFNRFGEPGVSTNAISADLNISPGNLYYHFPAKDDLINALCEQYEQALMPILQASEGVSNVEDAWFFMHSVLEANWQYRFIYRNLNELLSRNRQLETRVRLTLDELTQSLLRLLNAMQRSGALIAPPIGWGTVARSMVLLLVFWLSYEYALDPRNALEEENAQNAAMRNAAHVLGLLAPYAAPDQQAHLQRLIDAYTPEDLAPEPAAV
ncbi:TetR/AcrR family transcriptional regulator [Diaphorobacter sp. HDW4A]|uniref:TetR/AcrR family transcriptional regulator n=1 Tax=Diaphorobacter sp. HDW4A TaxID=2714924 RepID=UPI00140D412A|nr:TetR/AcrR family transcriptional regulator [Diaphorobacter sp. HDW4A]QIL81876.1 TetR/AcrR family transcriptional regulator [Diaphorobacter sp. HDW4A]